MTDSLTSYPKIIETELDEPSSVIRIAFLDVGQGDTIVISSPDTSEALVVDCVDANAVIDYLKHEKIKYLRGIIVTHLHQDHYSQVDDLLYRSHLVPGMRACEKLAFRVIHKKDYDRVQYDSDGHEELGIPLPPEEAERSRKTTLQNMRDWCLEDKTRHFEPVQPATEMPLKGTLRKNIRLVHPYPIDLQQWETNNLNNTSTVLRVRGAGSSAFLTGDLEPSGWRVLQENFPDLKSDILKFPHHGGAWNASDTDSLLNSVKPSVVILSVGTDGEKYKHPNKEVFDVLASPPYSHIRVLCTQATNQCEPFVRNQKNSVLQLLNEQAASKSTERIGSKRGCPCAGTIIVELGKNACVVQPTISFHRNSVILPHFHTHKCIFT